MLDPMTILAAKWEGGQILFDDGSYCVVVGTYLEDKRWHVGERWNGPFCEYEVGFPIDKKARSDWHLVPKFLEIPLLYALFDELNKNPKKQTVTAGRDRRDLVVDTIKASYAQKKNP